MLELIGEGVVLDNYAVDDEISSTYEDYDDMLLVVSGNQAPVDDLNFCRYRFRVFPAQESKEAHETNEPTVYAIAAIFVLASVIFVIHDLIFNRQ